MYKDILGKKCMGGTFLVAQSKVQREQRPANEFTVQCRKSTKDKKSIYSVTFSSLLKPQVNGFRYIALYKSQIARKLLFVFNNEGGFELKDRIHDDCLAIYGKELVTTICNFIGIDATQPVRLHLSANIADSEEMATFEICL